jgi:hypothetical protein
MGWGERIKAKEKIALVQLSTHAKRPNIIFGGGRRGWDNVFGPKYRPLVIPRGGTQSIVAVVLILTRS